MRHVSSTDILTQKIIDLLISGIPKKPIDHSIPFIRDRLCLIMRFQIITCLQYRYKNIGTLVFLNFMCTGFDHAQQPFSNEKRWALGSTTLPTATTQLCWGITFDSFFPHTRANGQTFSSLPTPYFRPIHKESIWSHCMVGPRDRRHQGFSLPALRRKNPGFV